MSTEAPTESAVKPVDEETVDEVNQLAEGIRAKARHHERLSKHHRQKSRDLMNRLAKVKRRCTYLGIHVEE
jgi:hypothetical protein